MGKFVYIYVGGPGDSGDGADTTAQWMSWFGTLGESVVDVGNPFAGSTTLRSSDNVSAGSQSGVTGYTIVSAADLDTAVAMAKSCPIFASGGSVEVHSAVDMG